MGCGQNTQTQKIQDKLLKQNTEIMTVKKDLIECTKKISEHFEDKTLKQ